RADIRVADGVICPPFFDDHIHIPQHPIRGRFMEGIGPNPDGGRLIAGLNRNVFPTEAKCSDESYTRDVVRTFLADTLAHGVLGGSAYMTVHTAATRIALEMLPSSWSVGLVMMNQNCPAYFRTDEANFERDAEALARDFARRFIPTDRFAVACDSQLRKRGVRIAVKHKLRMQTHLNEQLPEKHFVEQQLYPGTRYTDVYARDGELGCNAILAHCVHNPDPELETIARCGAVIAHCPTSNTLLGSGIMPLDAVIEHGIDYAICTDVGASPTTSILCEMAQFLKVHAGRSKRATPSEALYRSTRGAARMMGLEDQFGALEVGRPMSFVEIECSDDDLSGSSIDEVVLRALLDLSPLELNGYGDFRVAFDRLHQGNLDTGTELELLTADVTRTAALLDSKVRRVTLAGQPAWPG
ncbi:MAG: amidohydrolase family protein, partial [Tepidisphaeraceae bacterium]